MDKPVKPMRAASATDTQIDKLLRKFGRMFASPKLDGIRCSIQNGVAYTKSLKFVPNPYIQEKLGSQPLYNGYDGELIVGNPTAHDVYRATYGGVMRKHGKPDFKLYVFDDCVHPYPYRIRKPVDAYNHAHIVILEQVVITTLEEMYEYENVCLDQGYEGIVLRDPNSMYKHGKATALEGGSIKVKRFTDGEATVISMEEQMHNGNKATTNELGRTQRSSHKKNKVPMETMGKLICMDLETGVEVRVGTGFSAELRQEIWDNCNTSQTVIGTLIKYKSFKIGVKDKPRHAVYLGPRDPSDM